ncbi:Stf0 family sulfotransferase [Rhodococcus sp. SORGH_AS_0301]|uniref:trehalose 2-sulfotransferase n=1 Tax=Rhodococcus sp. SORGH_AS_0301 TaxID=3041780 RepID=UPI002786BF0B|nr:Stf0 family sulfotransferase [Rhodococcus sp. SORGH_AS_0301]MDQ1181840.1 LPS sulfotransferase NodH [Rhodococcus sp. SORGH_AS_0301]
MTSPRSYLVLASQRSGSTLLVETLRATRQAGEPQEFFQYLPDTSLPPQPREWFDSVSDTTVTSLLAPLESGAPWSESAEEWRFRILREGRTPNGVWAGKLMWNQTPLLIRRADSLPGRTPPGGDALRAAVDDVLGDVAFVKVTRRDLVPQAVSFWRAVQTRVWRGRADPAVDAAAQYHPAGIAHLLSILQGQEKGWRSWFDATGITPFEVDFDELTTDTAAVTASVLDHLGLDPSLAPEPALRKQSDARSDDWIARYRADAAQRGLPS